MRFERVLSGFASVRWGYGSGCTAVRRALGCGMYLQYAMGFNKLTCLVDGSIELRFALQDFNAATNEMQAPGDQDFDLLTLACNGSSF